LFGQLLAAPDVAPPYGQVGQAVARLGCFVLSGPLHCGRREDEMLSPSDRAEFDRRGVLRLPGAIPAPEVTAMRERIWADLAAQHGIARDRPGTWSVERPGFQALTRSGAFTAVATGTVRAALDDLLGVGGWLPPAAWGRPLVTFPAPGGTWDVPASGWHVDSHGFAHELPGVTVFGYLTPVLSRGGATAVLVGSHHLMRRHLSAAAGDAVRPADIKAALAARHPWLRELWSAGDADDRVRRFLDRHAVIDGVPVRVAELTGAPGDVVLMDSQVLHAATRNCRAAPRMMLLTIIGRKR
jgi:hypothetical protein